jgi:hypothetical protein
MTRKSHVASSTMVRNIVGSLSPGAINRVARYNVNEDARRSEGRRVDISSGDRRRSSRTVKEEYPRKHDLYVFVLDE